MKKITSLLSFIILSLTVTGIANGQSMREKNPPAAAFSACTGKNINTSCRMNTRRGFMNGTCQQPRGLDKAVCVPEHQNAGHNSNNQQTRSSDNRSSDNNRNLRKHTATQSSGVRQLFPATENPIAQNYVSSQIDGEWRIIRSNGISNHKTGQFPNRGNPNRITEQNFSVRVSANPQFGSSLHRPKVIGWLLNGVPFEPGAGEFYMGERSLGWQYEALSGAVPLGLDENHAHVQPSGKYHYHGLPTLFLKKLGVTKGKHSAQIGWAADGFPIFALYGQQGEVKASYRLKSGNRPAGYNQPGGQYDGTFTQDYEYVEGLGDLDECNGTMTITADYPNGTYAYFLTNDYPVVPRCLKGRYSHSL